MKISVTKKFEFCYSHQLPNHKGLCKNLHGHNGILEVTLSLSEDQYQGNHYDNDCPGMVMDFGHLKDDVTRAIINKLDHQYLNDVLPEEFLPPTAENTIMWIYQELYKFYDKMITRIRLYETSDSYAELTI